MGITFSCTNVRDLWVDITGRHQEGPLAEHCWFVVADGRDANVTILDRDLDDEAASRARQEYGRTRQESAANKSMNMKRMRGRNHRSGGGGPIRHNNGQVPLNRNHVFDSNGPDMRLRGTAQQLYEKYLQLGRDASSSDDRVAAEGYFQHAEHYFRIVNAVAQAQQNQANHQGQGQHHQGQHNQGQRRYVDLDEGGDDDGSNRTDAGGGQGGGVQGAAGQNGGQRDYNSREFQPRDRNQGNYGQSSRDERRDGQPRESYREREGRSNQREGQRESAPYRDRDQRYRQSDVQPVSHVTDQHEQGNEVAHARRQQIDLSAPEPERPARLSPTVDLTIATAAAASHEAESQPGSAETAGSGAVASVTENAAPVAEESAPVSAPTPRARAPRVARPRRRPAAAAAEPEGTGEQPDIRSVPDLTTVED